MKNLLTSLLFVMNDSDKIVLFILILLFVVFIFILYKNTTIKKIKGTLTSVEEVSVLSCVTVYPNNPLSIVETTKKKILFEVKCQGTTVKILLDPGNYIERIKEKIKKEVKVQYIKIKFIDIRINFILNIE